MTTLGLQPNPLISFHDYVDYVYRGVWGAFFFLSWEGDTPPTVSTSVVIVVIQSWRALPQGRSVVTPVVASPGVGESTMTGLIYALVDRDLITYDKETSKLTSVYGDDFSEAA